jgi:hypothetical protein
MWWLVFSRDRHRSHQNRSSGRHILPAFLMVFDRAFFGGFDLMLGWFGAAWLRSDHGSHCRPCANFIKQGI